tara:strand:- start:566 stop:1546 length:981 start_codon:yes stop_codon:yes gene_type:complete
MSDNAQAVGSMTVNEAAQSFASMLDTQEGVDTGAEAQTEEEQSESEEVESTEPQEEVEEASENVEGEDEEAEEQTPRNQKFIVKVDGKEIEVPKEELIRGYQREADYTRKTQKLAEERKYVESEFQQVRGEREQYAQILGQLQQKLQEFEPAEPDWNRLEYEDPTEYARQWTSHQRRLQQKNAVFAEQLRLQQMQQAESQKQIQNVLQQEVKILKEKIPEWSSPEKAKTEGKALLEYGLGLGFSEQELNGISDSRALLALHKAWKYDQMVSKRPELQAKIKKAPRMASPGSAGSVSSKSSDINNAKKRLAQTGSVRDAASLFEKFI